jgi:hypothetical protein
MLDADVLGCTERIMVYRQHAHFAHDDQFEGPWGYKHRGAQEQIDDLSPEVVL